MHPASGLALDLHTIYVAAVGAALLFGVIIILLAGFRAEHRDIRLWGWGTLVTGVGVGLFLMQPALPGVVSVDIGNGLVAVGYLLCLQSVRMFRGMPVLPRWDWVMLAIALAGVYWFHHVDDDLHLRTALMSAVVFAIMATAGTTLLRAAPRSMPASWRFTGGALLLYGMLHLARTTVILATDYPNDISVPKPVDGILLLAFLLSNIIAVLGVMWMHLDRAQDQLRHLATHDPLTGLLNRAAFAEAFSREASRAARGGADFSLVMMDIDHFKRINDQHGHPAGDEVLRRLAAVLTAEVRPSDSLGRYGGEEFALLMPDAAQDGAVLAANRMRAAVEAADFDTQAGRLKLTISAGVAGSAPGRTTWDTLVPAADGALYRAKQGGRNRVEAA